MKRFTSSQASDLLRIEGFPMKLRSRALLQAEAQTHRVVWHIGCNLKLNRPVAIRKAKTRKTQPLRKFSTLTSTCFDFKLISSKSDARSKILKKPLFPIIQTFPRYYMVLISYENFYYQANWFFAISNSKYHNPLVKHATRKGKHECVRRLGVGVDL
jgi:hypothetical protein